MKLYYFDVYGRAEPMRMALHKYGVQFEDVRLTPEQFGELKTTGKLEYGQVPALELDDGTMLCQSAAIQRYIELKYSDNDQDPMLAYER
jgi:glutathione S-transferase